MHDISSIRKAASAALQGTGDVARRIGDPLSLANPVANAARKPNASTAGILLAGAGGHAFKTENQQIHAVHSMEQQLKRIARFKQMTEDQKRIAAKVLMQYGKVIKRAEGAVDPSTVIKYAGAYTNDMPAGMTFGELLGRVQEKLPGYLKKIGAAMRKASLPKPGDFGGNLGGKLLGMPFIPPVDPRKMIDENKARTGSSYGRKDLPRT